MFAFQKGQSSAEWLLAVVFLLFCVSSLTMYFSQAAKYASLSVVELRYGEFLSKSSLAIHSGILSGGKPLGMGEYFQANGNCLSIPDWGACQMMPSQMHSEAGVIKYGGVLDETI